VPDLFSEQANKLAAGQTSLPVWSTSGAGEEAAPLAQTFNFGSGGAAPTKKQIVIGLLVIGGAILLLK
jgi:hypothetical protein